jgi:hypothetical protein
MALDRGPEALPRRSEAKGDKRGLLAREFGALERSRERLESISRRRPWECWALPRDAEAPRRDLEAPHCDLEAPRRELNAPERDFEAPESTDREYSCLEHPPPTLASPHARVFRARKEDADELAPSSHEQ